MWLSSLSKCILVDTSLLSTEEGNTDVFVSYENHQACEIPTWWYLALKMEASLLQQ